MINISGYVTDVDEDLSDLSQPLTVNSCGHYQLVKMEKYRTVRTGGRKDYQLLYFANGAGDFLIEGKRRRIPAHTAVLYYPGETQDYAYALQDRPEIYWLHFSGAAADRYLDALRLASGERHVFAVGAQEEYAGLFQKIIQELQLKRHGFFAMANLYGEELLTLMARYLYENERSREGLAPRAKEVEEAIHFFHHAYNTPVNIGEYAVNCGITPGWFIRIFKRQTGATPQQYLTKIRLTKAKELLSTSSLPIGEIAAVCGYQDCLYFSKLFRKHEGCTPSEFRENSAML